MTFERRPEVRAFFCINALLGPLESKDGGNVDKAVYFCDCIEGGFHDALGFVAPSVLVKGIKHQSF